MADVFQIGMVLYPKLTQLDLTGPFEVFSRLPDVQVQLLWKTLDPVTSDTGLTMMPTCTFADCPALDVICVPGGPGQMDLMEDQELLGFLRTQGEHCEFVTSVCTGSLLLGAAGLLDGYKATTHWSALPFLESFGAEPVKERVVWDRNRVTGGGVTAGIDFALTLAAKRWGEDVAKAIQLGLEYDPAPPFDAGSPDRADEKLLTRVMELLTPRG